MRETPGNATPSRGLLLVLLAALVFAALLLALPDDSAAAVVGSSAGLVAAAGTFAALAVQRARREGPRRAAGRRRWGWLLLAASGLAFAAGQCAWAVQQLTDATVSFPSWAEALFLAQFPLTAAGVLCLAAGSMPVTSGARTVLDALLTVTALLLLSWDLALEPAYRSQAGAGIAALAVAVAYPLAHVAVLSLIAAVAAHSGRFGRELGFLGAGMAVSAVTYTAFGWLVYGGAYSSGALVDVGWVLAFGLMALAARGTVPAGDALSAGRTSPRAAWRAPAVVPLSLVALSMLVSMVELHLSSRIDVLQVWLGVAVVGLLLARQGLSLRENAALTRRLEQRVAERTAELLASRRRYQSVLDSVHEVIVQADAHGRVLFLSRAWEHLTGRPLDEPVGRPLATLAHPEDAAVLEGAAARALRTGAPAQARVRVVDSAGSTRWTEASLHPAREARGAEAALSGTLRDVTDRIRAEDALRESEERCRLLLESTGEGIFGLDLAGRCTFLNAAAATMIGRPPEEVLGVPLHSLVHHTRADGTPHPEEECPVLPEARAGRGCHLAEELFWRSDGTSFPVEINARPVLKHGDVSAVVVTFTDVTGRRAAEDEVRRRALHDPLTDLPNRTLLADRLEQALAGTRRSRTPTALMVLDLDGFKDVNDRHGHPTGDELLREVAARLTAPGLLRAQDTVARLGGDEFAVVLPALGGAEDAQHVAAKVLAAITEPVRVATGLLRVGCSLGIAVAPDDAADPQSLLQRADVAMYLAKARGGGAARYHAEHDRARLHRLELADELREAIGEGRLDLHYQPIVDLRSGRTAHLEALCRWHSPERGSVPAQTFVDVAEEAGLMGALTAYVLGEAHRQSQAWRSAGLEVTVAVNLSASTLHEPDLLRLAHDWCTSDPPAGPLEIEVTESAVMAHPALAVEQLQRLADLGVRVSIDDFGTGYSSLAHLRDMPVHAVKIDRSFLAGARGGAREESIVESIIQLGHTLDLTVIAEGVETAETARRLSELGCDKAQGWHFGHPEPAARLTARLLEEDVVVPDGHGVR
ncbi:PAS domain S-box-containing protein/diguanylate cyclase (GGDEF)-like protein [Kineococcus xinjiangensis]|uniref:PAS domain S-box-containing protein/diguanylate cyclase (GGDEF)-like protein n=1 Tax=Kineococcus xinjiangensis TaxID=512762 RepID=A0A2S6IJ63_9ACTN|nr:bifunctional diguanylate cyclase/phosphodiesterase [Kineococcus xinjiangensis]PPK94263.1 PAS domain S-box-containing protein/diguanylate cyclase (GGDEF)-like protein [Kineococcus xinjiangensis]